MRKRRTLGDIIRQQQKSRTIDSQNRYSIYKSQIETANAKVTNKITHKNIFNAPRRVRTSYQSTKVRTRKLYAKKTNYERFIDRQVRNIARNKKFTLPSAREIKRSIARVGKENTIKKYRQSLLHSVSPVSEDTVTAILDTWGEYPELQRWGEAMQATGVTDASFRDMFQTLYLGILGEIYHNPSRRSAKEWREMLHAELMNVTPQAVYVGENYKTNIDIINSFVDILAKKI